MPSCVLREPYVYPIVVNCRSRPVELQTAECKETAKFTNSSVNPNRNPSFHQEKGDEDKNPERFKLYVVSFARNFKTSGMILSLQDRINSSATSVSVGVNDVL